MRRPSHDDGGFCELRAALRASIHAAASVSFSETSRKNCAVRFSVSGATSSLTKLFMRSSSSSIRLPNSSNLSINDKSSEISPCREEARRLGYYRNAVCGPQGGELALPYRWQWRVEKWKNAMRGFFGGGDQQPRPKICPACGTLVGISATRCHECGTSLRFSLAALTKKL